MVEGEGDDQLNWTWCHSWVPLQCAIVVCYGGGRGGWRPTLGEWTWCHCWVPLQGHGAIVVWYGGKGRVTTAFGGVDVPLQGARGSLHRSGALSFLQTTHCSLHCWHKNWFLLSGVYASIIFLWCVWWASGTGVWSWDECALAVIC